MPPTKHTFSGSIPLPIIHFQHLALIHASFWGVTPPSSHTFLAKSEGVNPPLMFIHYQKCRIHPPYSWTSWGRGSLSRKHARELSNIAVHGHPPLAPKFYQKITPLDHLYVCLFSVFVVVLLATAPCPKKQLSCKKNKRNSWTFWSSKGSWCDSSLLGRDFLNPWVSLLLSVQLFGHQLVGFRGFSWGVWWWQPHFTNTKHVDIVRVGWAMVGDSAWLRVTVSVNVCKN